MHLVEQTISPYETSVALNEAPMSILKFVNPREAFRALKAPNELFNNTLNPFTPSPIRDNPPPFQQQPI
jgi:hypothetical protein